MGGVDYLMREILITISTWLKVWANFETVLLFTKPPVLSGIPGKIDVSGDSVAQMWLDNQLPEILAYNEFDAFTTHLLWARMAHFSALLDTRDYEREQELVRELLEAEIAEGKEHLVRFVDEWIDYFRLLDNK